MFRTYQPKKRQRSKEHGFRARMAAACSPPAAVVAARSSPSDFRAPGNVISPLRARHAGASRRIPARPPGPSRRVSASGAAVFVVCDFRIRGAL